MEKTYYDKFGIKENANEASIKKAYRRLALKYHPDRNGGDFKYENIFKQVNEIYQTLSDPIKRKEYDAELERIRQATEISSSATSNYNGSSSPNTTYSQSKEKYKWQYFLSVVKKYVINNDISDYILKALGCIITIFIIWLILTPISSKNSTVNSSTYDYQISIPQYKDSLENSQPTGEIVFEDTSTKVFNVSKKHLIIKKSAVSLKSGEVKF